jgi:HEAT repeat protein
LPSVDKLLADLVSHDESAAEEAVPMLAQRGIEIFPRLLELLDSEDADRRWWAVRTLAAMSEPRQDWLRRALADPEPEIRAAAALAFTAHPEESAASSLVQCLGDEDSVVAVLAVGALVQLGGPVVPLLLDAFENANPSGRIHVMRALAEMRDPRAIKLMMNSLDAESATLRYWVREGLERLGLNMVYLSPE